MSPYWCWRQRDVQGSWLTSRLLHRNARGLEGALKRNLHAKRLAENAIFNRDLQRQLPLEG